MQTAQLRQLKKDLDSYEFMIIYRDTNGNRQEMYFWIPSPFGLCAIKLGSRRGALVLRVTDEDLTNPSGPGTEEFERRAGVPGMTSPEEYGLVAVKKVIPLADIIELRIRFSHATDDQVTWKRNEKGKFTRKGTKKYMSVLR